MPCPSGATSMPAPARNAVRVVPGWSTLTCTPCGARCSASTSDRAATKCLLAAYAARRADHPPQRLAIEVDVVPATADAGHQRQHEQADRVMADDGPCLL